MRATRRWGDETEYSRQHLNLSEDRMCPDFYAAYLRLKRALARTNAELRVITPDKCSAIETACASLLRELDDGETETEQLFPLSIWASTTHYNMNVNELVAHHQQDAGIDARAHVNASQSTNDTFLCAAQLGLFQCVRTRALPFVESLRRALTERARAWGARVKVGRTHLNDAALITLEQEWGAHAHAVSEALEWLKRDLPALLTLPLGGTVVGTGVAAPAGFARRAQREVAREFELPIALSRHRMGDQAMVMALARVHASLASIAGVLKKIANDVRWQLSGPRAGLGEMTLPASIPGSSIVPGKSNPTAAEATVMAAYDILGTDTMVQNVASAGEFQLNVLRPVVVAKCFRSSRLLGQAAHRFDVDIVRVIEPRIKNLRKNTTTSTAFSVALVPHVGFKTAVDTVQNLLAAETPHDDQAPTKVQLDSLSPTTRARVQADIAASLQREAVSP